MQLFSQKIDVPQVRPNIWNGTLEPVFIQFLNRFLPHKQNSSLVEKPPLTNAEDLLSASSDKFDEMKNEGKTEKRKNK